MNFDSGTSEKSQEFEVIQAIYSDCLTRLNDDIIEIIIPDHPWCKVRLSFADSYPDTIPNILSVESTRKIDKVHEGFEDVVKQCLKSAFDPGNVCVFEFVSAVQEALLEYEEEVPEEIEPEVVEEKEDGITTVPKYWHSSEPITDRGSTFIGFACEIHSESEVFSKLQELRSVKRIKRSQHSMCAWRIKNENGTIISDYDDDGETAAGSRMLHLMTLMDVWNCLVVDVRWFNGVHIGPDRFKHINSTAREVIVNFQKI